MRKMVLVEERMRGCGREAGLLAHLRDFNTSVVGESLITIAPRCIGELWRADDNVLRIWNWEWLDVYMYSRRQTEHEAGVRAVEDEVAARQEDLSRGRHGFWRRLHCRYKMTEAWRFAAGSRWICCCLSGPHIIFGPGAVDVVQRDDLMRSHRLD